MTERTAVAWIRKSTRTRSGKFKPHVQIQDRNVYLDVRTYQSYATESEADAAAERIAEEFKRVGLSPINFQP